MNTIKDLSVAKDSASRMLDVIVDDALDPLFWKAQRTGPASAWWSHLPFAHWLVAACTPQLIVELGTRTGVSHGAFCEAVRHTNCGARIFAIGSWHDAACADTDLEFSFKQLQHFNEEHYRDFSILLQSASLDAIKYFNDYSIDILHIDEIQDFEEVSKNFGLWLRKLSTRAVILVHNTNAKMEDAGVGKFFGELAERFPSFEFLHGRGLGVLAVGPEAPAAIMDLCHVTGPDEIATMRDRFAFLGDRWVVAAREANTVVDFERRLDELRNEHFNGDVRIEESFAHTDRLLRDLATKTAVAAAAEDSLKRVHEALASACADVTGKAAEIVRLERRAAIAENDATKAKGEHGAVERMRQYAVTRVSELRRALDAVGTETNSARNMISDVAQRYAAAVNQHHYVGRSDLRAHIGRSIARLVRNQLTPQLSEDIDLLTSSIYFDNAWYLETYPDVRDQGKDPVRHYLLHGGNEGRDPSRWFSTGQYLRNNPDVAAAGANALLHFLRYGEGEGRTDKVLPVISLPRAMPVAKLGPKQGISCIFITGEPESAGHRYRVLDFIDAAAANEIAARWVRADDLTNRHAELGNHDIAVFWRVAWTEEVGAAIAHLRECGRRIIFDVDDLMTEPNLATLNAIDGIRTQSLTEDIVRMHYGRVRRTMTECDFCFTTTEELAFYLRDAGKTTFVIANGFNGAAQELSRLAVRKRRKEASDGLIRIGYAGGSKTHQRDFAICVEAVAQMLRDDARCRLVLFRAATDPLLDTAEFSALAGLHDRIEWREAVPLAELPLEMARFDINLAPLEIGNPYCEAKSELKFFEAALVDVPTIASPTGPFRRAIEHGKSGLLAASADDWLACLLRLVGDPGLRTTMGVAARRAALGRFGPETKALRLGNIIAQLSGGLAAARGFALDARLANWRPPAPVVFPSQIVFEQDKLGAADVTVVVPLYNYQYLVEETLESVAVQADPVDLIIVDGHSTDDSLNVARRWAERNADRFNRILVIQNSANYGLGLCRNSGIDAAETPYIVLLDADNKLLPSACRELADHARRTGAAFVYPTIQHFGASQALMGNQPFEPHRLAPGNYIDALALVSVEAWAIVGGVDHVRHGWEDYDFWCRLAEMGLRGEWLDLTLAQYRVHPNSMQTNQTQVPENYRRLQETFKARHPWVSLHDQERARQLPAARSALTRPADKSRLDRLLPILRCPITQQKLGYNADRSALVSFDGLRTWPIKAGRPALSPGASDVAIHGDQHVSNNLPKAALDLIQEANGWVLNLSAGGTATKYENVVEAEYAIFRNTDVVADAHALPFDDNAFEAALVINAFEHYRDPKQVVAELHRVLKPGGRIVIVTAFLQPLHEKPWHFYNCTRYGLEEWFAAFQTERINVSPALSPNFTIGWATSEIETALRIEQGAAAATGFLDTRVADLVGAFRDPAGREVEFWKDIARLSQPRQEIVAAGFEFIGRKGDGIPVYVK